MCPMRNRVKVVSYLLVNLEFREFVFFKKHAKFRKQYLFIHMETTTNNIVG